MSSFEVICESLEDTSILAEKITPLLKNGCFISLFG